MHTHTHAHAWRTASRLLTTPFLFRATVSQECITAYNDLKLSKKHKFIIFKLSDDNREIVVEEASSDGDWENFREKLINATAKSKSVSSTVLEGGWWVDTPVLPAFSRASSPPEKAFYSATRCRLQSGGFIIY